MTRADGTGGTSDAAEKVREAAADRESDCGGPAAAAGGAVDAVEAPDGGWGWVVLGATIVVLALTLAFPSCMGIFYTDLQNEFHATNSETSWVPSIMTSVLHAGGRVRSSPRAPERTFSGSLMPLAFGGEHVKNPERETVLYAP
ncbi:Monocarboxylate transporter 6 [Liparis tanakae]|uniref:Monocarboxylate transporter 6 n=1 Tax=Liparis tanakae TaxID=230148 RepID=A0A4Z2EUE9_9TELE|nr:Monocarboxylate transporter 6 [Liparis tanakae]